MKKWGLDIKDPAVSFKEADKDGKGIVLFSEFCEWAIKKNLDIDDDDDAMWFDNHLFVWNMLTAISSVS